MARSRFVPSQELVERDVQAPPVGFMRLATETRLDIYGWVFNTIYPELPPWAPSTNNQCESYDCERRRDKASQHPTVRNGVPTELLRVNKKIYNEALPVMWEHLHFMARYEPTCTVTDLGYMRFTDVVEDTEMAAHIRSLTIVSSVDDVVVETVPNLVAICETLQERLPMLAELRLHLDIERWNFQLGYIVPPRSRVELLAPLAWYNAAPVVFIGLHAHGQLSWTSTGPINMCSEWVNKAVKFLEIEATKRKKTLEFRIWE